MQRSIRRIRFSRIFLTINSVFIILLFFNNSIYETKLKNEIEQLKFENASLQTRLEDKEEQFELLFDKFLQTYFQNPKTD